MGNSNGEYVRCTDHDVDSVTHNHINQDAYCYQHVDGNKHNHRDSDCARDSSTTSGDNRYTHAPTNEHTCDHPCNSADKTGSAIEDESNAWSWQ